MARKRSNRVDDEPDEEQTFDDEDEDFEDEDEDEEARPTKRKFNPFIDEMAIVDDDEEEEDEDDDYTREDGFIEESEDVPSATAIQRRHLDLDRRRREVEDMDDEQVAAFYTQKYGGRKTQAYKTSEEIPQQLLLPSVNDPNLWMVKCKPGKEKDIIFGLMKRYFDRQYSDNPLETFSAFARESLKGYVYIEAKRQAHVQQALANVPFVYHTSLMLVPIKDMIDSINIPRKDVEIPLGGWVRVRRGKYAGDLAQVLEVTDSQDNVRLKLVPRLELDTDEDDANRKRKKGAAARPQQRLFNPERLGSRHISSLQKKGPYWLFNGDQFRDGYLEKYMKVATIQIEDVTPTLDEVAKFAGGGELNPEEGDRMPDLTMLSNQTVTNAQASSLFQPGDTVEVIEGDMIHSTGVVQFVKESDVIVAVQMEGFQKRVTLPPKLIRKKFKEGDHVKVINGRYKDESGMVVNVKDSVITMLSDASMKEVKVFAKDLREAAEITLGRTVIGNYELHDLVQLDFYTVGVIIKVDRESFKVLTQNEEVRTVSPHQITNKRDSKRAIATDGSGNSIRSGDTVMETDGEKRTCTILHLYRSLVFLHSRENPENYGVRVTNTRSVTSVAAKNRSGLPPPQQGRDLSRPQPFGNAPGFRGGHDGRGRGRGARGGFYGRGQGGRDNLVAKTVRIAQGPHKGYLGIVKDTTDTMARVELHTNCKIISVDKAKLVLVDAQGGTIGPVVENDRFSNGPSEFSGPSATPRRYGDGAMTPMHYASGARTPAWNAGTKTPNPYSSDGSKSSAWDTGSKTPNPYAFNDGSKTPAWDSGSKTPMWGAETPRWGGMSAKTPGFTDSGNKTPMWGNRYNDNDIAPTPAAHSLVAPTPAPTYNAAPSPAPFPQTPAANFAPTPYETAPTPYEAASAPTPAAHMLTAPTPGSYIPTTPAVTGNQQTSFMPSGGDYHQVEEEEHREDWPIEEIEVKVLSAQSGASEGQIGSIVSFNPSSRSCQVLLYDTSATVEIGYDSLDPIRPSKKDNVKVILGEHRGELGSLVGVDSHDGIVRLKGGGSGFKIMGMGAVGKYTGNEDVM
ncbi:transcription elongation factor spt5 [Apophysomyces sp. BC1034]|nr:transcription elongation factor spt5 [Apophysomyces sp. BC1015]KAG0175660.1 transcription elongation factor spt5 [Apophysomyces sp. BC1021]KAG0186121.1 transcription elongation factor spt5 [Apophysomyces sp. BC1034]